MALGIWISSDCCLILDWHQTGFNDACVPILLRIKILLFHLQCFTQFLYAFNRQSKLIGNFQIG